MSHGEGRDTNKISLDPMLPDCSGGSSPSGSLFFPTGMQWMLWRLEEIEYWGTVVFADITFWAVHGIGEKCECRNISGLNWKHLQSPGFHLLCTSLQLCKVPSNKPFISEETQLLDSSILSSLLRHLGLFFCGSKHPQLLLFLSHVLLSKSHFATRSPQLQSLLELWFGSAYTKPTININSSLAFSLVFLLCYVSQTHTF